MSYHQSKKIICVIPARLQSQRFPRKILASLQGKPLIQWVWEAAKRVPFFHDVVIAIDDVETGKVIDGFQGKHVMTSLHCLSGTERLAELVEKGFISGDIYVNWQGDEPFIQQQMIADLLQSCLDSDSDVWTLKKKVENSLDATSPHLVKVVVDARDFALYFSRAPIPHFRDKKGHRQEATYKHVGIYAYTHAAIKKIGCLPVCELEEAEQLEQLRFLFHGLKIKVHTTNSASLGIDLPEHLLEAEKVVKKFFS
jgi:3-deoxy-manno-octulosonate cytidylyltransferase (CMP-KDO synthetase)